MVPESARRTYSCTRKMGPGRRSTHAYTSYAYASHGPWTMVQAARTTLQRHGTWRDLEEMRVGGMCATLVQLPTSSANVVAVCGYFVLCCLLLFAWLFDARIWHLHDHGRLGILLRLHTTLGLTLRASA